MILSLGSINLLEQFTEPRETVTRSQFIVKGCNSGTDRQKTYRGQGMEEELSVHALSKLTAPPVLHVFTKREASEPCPFGGFARHHYTVITD